MNDSNHKENSGYLVYLFRGHSCEDEIEVFRKICMRFNLQAWDEMHTYLPWRSRLDLRTLLCHTIKKQSVSDYSHIRADPFQISADNAQIKNSHLKNGYKLKSGILIHEEWNRTDEDRHKTQQENAKKYDLNPDEAYNIEIPAIMSVEYLQGQAMRRRQALKLYRAVLLYEKGKRKGIIPTDLGLNSVKIFHDHELRAGKAKLPIPYSNNVDKVISKYF